MRLGGCVAMVDVRSSMILLLGLLAGCGDAATGTVTRSATDVATDTRSVPPGAAPELADAAAGMRMRPLSMTPPPAGSVVGSIDVVVENTTAESIARDRIGAAAPILVIGSAEVSGGTFVLPAPSDWRVAASPLLPGGLDTHRVLVVRIEERGPVRVRGRVMVRDVARRLHVIGTDDTALDPSQWPVAEPLRNVDLGDARASGGAVHILFTTGGPREGDDCIEVSPDGSATVAISRWGRGDRGSPGLHASRLDDADRTGLLAALAAAPFDAWSSPDARNPVPADTSSFSLLVACGRRAKAIRGTWPDLERCGLRPVHDHLRALMKRLAGR